MQLSPNFTVAEFTRTSHKVENVPTLVHIRNMEALCATILEPLRAHFDKPITITSGYRGWALNKAVGGSATSYHTKGMAADIQIDGVTPLEICQWISENTLYTEVICEDISSVNPEGRWAHVAWDSIGRIKKLLTMRRNRKGKAEYLPGLQEYKSIS